MSGRVSACCILLLAVVLIQDLESVEVKTTSYKIPGGDWEAKWVCTLGYPRPKDELRSQYAQEWKYPLTFRTMKAWCRKDAKDCITTATITFKPTADIPKSIFLDRYLMYQSTVVQSDDDSSLRDLFSKIEIKELSRSAVTVSIVMEFEKCRLITYTVSNGKVGGITRRDIDCVSNSEDVVLRDVHISTSLIQLFREEDM